MTDETRTGRECQHCEKSTTYYCDDCAAWVCGPCADTGKHACWNARMARVRTAAGTALLALACIGLAPHGCTIVGTTGEGFPAVHCADGSFGYIDLDGTDGTLGTEGDGRYVVMGSPIA